MKTLPKFAIKYSEANWASVKIALDLIRNAGQYVEKRKDSRCFDNPEHKAKYIVFDEKECKYNNEKIGFYYWYNLGSDNHDYAVLSMPQDLSRLKEILSVEVPKDGDIYVFGDNGDWSHRIKDWNTETNTGSVYNITSATSFTLCNYLDTTKMVKANESEIKKRIEEEHTKGYYWTGSKLIKIPEYVQSCNDGIVKIKFDGKNMWKSETTASSFSILFVINQGRTKEAFEAQEAHKKMDEACKKLGFTKEYVEEITIKGFEAFVAGESLADMVRKYGVENATEFIQKNNRIDELEKEIKLVKEALSDCEKAYQDSVETGCNQAETIKDLIINNKKLTKDLQSTLDENVRLMDTINSVKSDLSKEIERRLNYANTISEMTIEWRKNPKRQAFKNLEKQIEKLREENKNLKDSLSQYSKCVV